MIDDEIPGPSGSVLLGSARDLQRDQLGTYERAMHAHGDFVRFRVGPPRVGLTFAATFHPDGARQVLGGSRNGWAKDAPVFTELRRLLGGGLTMLEGASWRDRRRLLQPLFTRQQVTTDVPAIVRTASHLADGIGPLDGGGVDLYDATLTYGLDVLGAILFGADVADDAPVLRSALPVVNDHIARRGLAPVRSPASWPTPANRRARRALADLHGLVGRMIARQRAGGGGALLGRLLDARDPETGAGLDDEAVREEVLIFLIAGYESTSTSLAFALHLLAQHPDVQDRVRAEVQAVVGDGTPTAEHLRELVVTRQVVQEALRLYPAVHTLVRRSTEGGRLMGRDVDRGRIIAVSIWGIHRNPRVWPEPTRFDPDRFTTVAAEDRDRYAYLPFGGGPRTCIGVHLALAELVLAVALVVRSHRLRARPGPPRLTAGVTLRPAEPLWCRVEPAGR